jgi:hypothetical protein
LSGAGRWGEKPAPALGNLRQVEGAGSDLSVFYSDMRVLDNDNFFVEVD